MNPIEVLELEIEAIINASSENIIVTDGSGVILRAVKNSEEMYGIPSADLVGKSVKELEKQKIFNPSVTLEVLEKKEPVRFMQQTGTGKVIMTQGIPLFDQDRKIIRVISFSHDMTEIEELKMQYEVLQHKMKRYEAEMQQLRNQQTLKDGVVIKSKHMQNVWDMVKRVANSDAAVVLEGESGTGKNVAARALHHGGSRRTGPLIEVNCGAIPPTLFESEMFGYEPGAFTGASTKGKPGLIELADKGTLFLDEVGELPMAIQVKLLKVLQEKKVTRMGGSKSRTVDFRVVAATNRDLESMVKQRMFRDDLYYRLNVVPITLPPLRERKEDILHFIAYFLEKFNVKYGTRKSFHVSAVDELIAYSWPGNVRELENLIERMVVTVDETLIKGKDLPAMQKTQKAKQRTDETVAMSTLQESLETVEKSWLIRAFRDCRSTYEMAEYLGMSQPTVVRRLKKYRINSKTI
ncbi:sigma-54 interaction domain-containing protein [Fictibacillus iocasae]|uniref:HTH-type transcriptional regulatory protein TyrR n=1 Tax=Fictibacillus iocasae TaxID=2715437 RepID=A0ABW2NVU2_9BACL